MIRSNTQRQSIYKFSSVHLDHAFHSVILERLLHVSYPHATQESTRTQRNSSLSILSIQVGLSETTRGRQKDLSWLSLRNFVDATILIVTSSVLSVFSVTKTKDGGGHEIPVKAGVIVDPGVVM